MKRGLTLIEIMIVVAIIAGLAAIAVPNFIESQVRSKVARVRTDLRSLATGIESYYMDNNRYPAADSSTWSGGSGFGINNVPGATAALRSAPTFRIKQNDVDSLRTLTTPVSYLTSYFVDPFATTRAAHYLYSTPSESLSLVIRNSGWIAWSFGPDADEVNTEISAIMVGSVQWGDGADVAGDIEYNLGSPPLVTESFYNPAEPTPPMEEPTPPTEEPTPPPPGPTETSYNPGLLGVTYDPTNGSTSDGDIYRTRQ